MASTPRQGEEPHRFGGEWTDRKLDVLRKYLSAYTTALKNQRFHLIYVDAFAGTGSRLPSDTGGMSVDQLDLLQQDVHLAEGLMAGSARLALESTPPFDEFLFVEQNASRCRQLEGLRDEFPGLDCVRIIRGEANEELRRLCSRNLIRERARAVVFLDPYGLQVDWATVEAMARTRAIDMWLLVPISGCNRMLERSGHIPESWAASLTRFFGTAEWKDHLYEAQDAADLFDGPIVEFRKAPMARIAAFIIERLRGAFVGVLDPPGYLLDDRGRPLFLLCFAASNRNGAPIALKIARDLTKDLT